MLLSWPQSKRLMRVPLEGDKRISQPFSHKCAHKSQVRWFFFSQIEPRITLIYSTATWFDKKSTTRKRTATEMNSTMAKFTIRTPINSNDQSITSLISQILLFVSTTITRRKKKQMARSVFTFHLPFVSVDLLLFMFARDFYFANSQQYWFSNREVQLRHASKCPFDMPLI